jgi:lipopolysaccharide/colanic/teichoic acid biosynthesis glycosyltransferase
VGIALLVLLFPFIGVMILLDSGGPVLYLSQERLGDKNGKCTKIIKFRTMNLNAEKDG